MQEIRLLKMRICNFKGIRELDITFNGKDMNVLGDNGTGKTTIIDSFTWLLFGKDSLDRADFGIKPTDSAGNIIHQLETSVEAVFDISGTEKVLRKTLTEVWSRKRGAAEAEFTRNENNFYIDGVPKKKIEYTSIIKELIDEDVFKIITNPLYFNESVNWKDRRGVLLTICGEVSDEDVIASNTELSPLLPLLEGKSVSDFKDIKASAMRHINQELDMIPVKINEAELAKPSAEALEIDENKKVELEGKIEALRVQKSGILNGTEALEARHKMKMLKEELANVGKNEPTIPDKTRRLTEDLRNAEFEIKTSENYQDMLERKITERKNVRIALSKEWDEIFAERFTDSVCPTCHRELPDDEVEAKTKEFNIKKATRLDEIEKKNENIGQEIDDLEQKLQDEKNKKTLLTSSIESLKEEIDKANAEKITLLENSSKQYEEERKRIETEIARVEALIRKYEESTEESVADIERQIATLESELSKINEAVANKALLEKQDKRIAELREQQTHLASEYTLAEKHLYLAEQFIVAKVNMLNERINAKFKYAKFKLFDKQINGGINEVCEVTYNGIPYKDLNNAMKINIGLDVINTISAHYGVSCPIMIDNCESVNEVFHTNAQQIRFYVSHDMKLVFEN